MAQEWAATTPDTRNFGQQVARLLDDLNQPGMQSIAQFYLQDAARYFQSKPFFFTDIVNDRTPGWGQTSPTSVVLPNLFYTHGATIVATASDNNQYAFVNLVGGTAGAAPPVFTPTLFTVPSNVTSPPHYTFGPGTTQDGGALWATVCPWPGQGVQFTQLCCIPFQNQYFPPLDYVVPRRIEVTWSSNLRIEMTKVSYGELRDYDVIRPTPPTTYPTFWAWYMQQIYLWPYPVGFYPITLSYRTGVPVPLQVTDSNFWTTEAEALIRNYAAYRINKVVLQDDVAAASFEAVAREELAVLTSQMIQQDQGGAGSGIPADIF